MCKLHNKTRDEILDMEAVEFLNDIAFLKDKRKKLNLELREMKTPESMIVHLLNNMV